MLHGLLWFPLLFVFVWLAYAGWNEYQKLESYKTWAAQFERAKYDIYSVLGQKDDEITWGKPTRKGPIDVQSCSLKQVRSLTLEVDGRVVEMEAPPSGRAIALKLELPQSTIQIPFTDANLAAEWGKFLLKQRQLVNE